MDYKAQLKAWATRREKMRKMRLAGKSLEEIGKTFGVSRQRVCMLLKRQS